MILYRKTIITVVDQIDIIIKSIVLSPILWVESLSKISPKTSLKNKSENISKTIQTPLLTVKSPKTKKANLENSHLLGSKVHKLHNRSEKIIIIPTSEPLKFKSILPNSEMNPKKTIEIRNPIKNTCNKKKWTKSSTNTNKLSKKVTKNLGKMLSLLLLLTSKKKSNKKTNSKNIKIKARSNNFNKKNKEKVHNQPV